MMPGFFVSQVTSRPRNIFPLLGPSPPLGSPGQVLGSAPCLVTRSSIKLESRCINLVNVKVLDSYAVIGYN